MSQKAINIQIQRLLKVYLRGAQQFCNAIRDRFPELVISDQAVFDCLKIIKKNQPDKLVTTDDVDNLIRSHLAEFANSLPSSTANSLDLGDKSSDTHLRGLARLLMKSENEAAKFCSIVRKLLSVSPLSTETIFSAACRFQALSQISITPTRVAYLIENQKEYRKQLAKQLGNQSSLVIYREPTTQEEYLFYQVALITERTVEFTRKYCADVADAMRVGFIPIKEIVNAVNRSDVSFDWTPQKFAEFLGRKKPYRVNPDLSVSSLDSLINSVELDGNSTIPQIPHEEDEIEGSIYWGQMSRENGQFGSHPIFDSYDDESGA